MIGCPKLFREKEEQRKANVRKHNKLQQNYTAKTQVDYCVFIDKTAFSF